MSSHRLTQIIEWVRETTDTNAGRGALVPVSGGSDSALCFWICAQALPRGRVSAAYAGTQLRCREWFENLGQVHYLPEPPQEGHPEAARWASMLSLSMAVRGWLVGTRNRTEEVLGTYSLASRVATYLPLAGLWKTEVMELARAVNVPAEILASSRQADPSCGRPQEMADIPLEIVDEFLKIQVGERPRSSLSDLPQQVVAYLDSILRRNQFKGGLPLRAPRAFSSVRSPSEDRGQSAGK